MKRKKIMFGILTALLLFTCIPVSVQAEKAGCRVTATVDSLDPPDGEPVPPDGKPVPPKGEPVPPKGEPVPPTPTMPPSPSPVPDDTPDEAEEDESYIPLPAEEHKSLGLHLWVEMWRSAKKYLLPLLFFSLLVMFLILLVVWLTERASARRHENDNGGNEFEEKY